MRIKELSLTIALIFGSANASAVSLEEFMSDAIDVSPKMQALESIYKSDLEAVKQEEVFYQPSLKYEYKNTFDVEKRGEERQSTITMRSTILKDNGDDVLSQLRTRAEISELGMDTEASNMKAQILSSTYKIHLYQALIEEGKRIVGKALEINADINQKVEGGLAKASDSTTSMVLIKEMESSILAINLKIDQIKLAVERVAGIPYPESLMVEQSEVKAFLGDTPPLNIKKNKSVQKKMLESRAAKFSMDAAQNWYSVDLYAKTEFDTYRFANDRTSEVGLELTVDLINPSSYWKERAGSYRYQSERYMLQQLERDTQLSLESQVSILDSNKTLWASQVESLTYKKDLIDERNNEYEINITSLYELIQSWNSYYATIQQKADTEATLVDTMISLQVLTGDL